MYGTCIAAAVAALAGVCSAQTIVSISASAPNGTFPVSSTDLANAGQPTFSSISLTSGLALYGSAVGNLVDGSMYGGSGYTDTAYAFVPSNGSVVTITFDTSLNAAGYDLSTIKVFAGSGAFQSRANQNYSVAWAAPGSGTYTNLFSVEAHDYGNSIETYTSTAMSDASILVTGVGSLRFTFADTLTGGPESMYREIDVMGSATSAVPEPSTYATVMGVAALGLAAWRRRSTADRPRSVN
jgi:hypothetical protein